MAVAAKPSRSSNLLKFTKTVRHGFPDKPSCMAYDCVQELFAFGSQSGEVVVLGHPGLETRFMAPASVQLIQFSINKGIVATYCSDHVCYFWSIQSSTPHLIGEFRLPPKESALVLYWPYNSNIVYIGTGNGNVLFVAVQVELVAGLMTSARVLLCEETVYWNKVVIPSQGFRRDHPGEIKSIEEHPLEANKILIAYSHGLCIIWNLSDRKVEYRQLHSTVECASWYGGSGKTYVLCTTEGQIRKVTLNSKKKEDTILYECPGVGSVTNFQSYNTKELKWLLFIQCTFSNNIYESRIIILGEKNTLTSLTVDDSIVDILCIPTKPFKAERQTPKALVVLQNSKLDVFDLQDNISADSKLCPFSIPFSFDHMKSSSWITFLHHGGECLSQNTIDKLTVLKTKLRVNRFHEGISSNKWPFHGGGGWCKNKRNEDHLPLLLVTSHSDKRDSITLWLYYADILEYLFTIETAKLFPLVYSISSTSSSAAASQGISSPKATNPSSARNSPDEEQTNTSEDSLDVKFVSVDMKRETMVFVNHRGNVLVYKFSQLQPDHERPNSTEILLNGDDEIDSPDDIASMLPWKFWASNERDTSQIHLLYHVCCVVNWEDSVKIVPVNSAVYNDEINMLLLGTHIAMVLTDMNSNGTIIINTIKGLKSLGLSSVSTCEKRTVVESKKKSGFSMFSARKRSQEVKSKTAVKPAQHEVTPLCASIIDIVYFTTSITEQPSQTVWLGTESGDLGIYSVMRSPEKRIMIKSIGITLHLKHAIANLIFLTEHFQIIHTNTKWHCSLPDPTATPTCERILNYVIVQTRKSLECHGFPAKSSTVFKSQNPVAKYTEIDKDILNSFSTKLKDKPFLLALIEGGNILLLSLPNLSPVTTLNVANDIKPSDFVTLSFNECGYGVYSIRPTEIQRVMISMTDTPMEDTQEGIEDTDGPGSSTYVPVTAPTKPNSGGRKILKFKTTDDVQQNRNDWFTPQRPRYGDKGFSHSLPSINQQQLATTAPPSPSTSSGTKKQVGAKSRYQPSSKSTKVTSQSTSPFERTAQALDERGKRLNKTVETTSKLLQLAEAYAENS